MPTRLVREGALDSAKLAGVSRGADAMFFRLLLVADDFGRFDGRVSVIRSRCFPAHHGIEDEHVLGWCSELFHAGLIHGYVVAGKPYLEIPNFHQRTRAKQSKFPSLEQADGQLTDVWLTNDGQRTSVSSVSVSVSVSDSVGGSQAGARLVDGKRRTNDGHLVNGRPESERAVSLRTYLASFYPGNVELPEEQWPMPVEFAETCKRLRPELDFEVVWARFRDHWIAQPASKATKIDWPATWRKWVRGERAPGAGRTSGVEAANAAAAAGWVAPEEKPVQGALMEPTE